LRFNIREAGGLTREIGPAVPTTEVAGWTRAEGEASELPKVRYAGGSADLSHILFYSAAGGIYENAEFVWPGDTTVFSYNSLYEYVGAGHTGMGGDGPRLVGMDAGGRLISQCGITLGKSLGEGQESEPGGLDTYNALSRDGRTVVFTAAHSGCRALGRTGQGPLVNELYARVEGSTRELIALSEPASVDCSECETSSAAQRQAHYQGASSDGAVVFFSTEQKLLAGAGGGESLYEFDFNAPEGHRVRLIGPVAPNSAEPAGKGPGVMRVSEDGSYVYFVSEDHELAVNHDARGFTALQEAGKGLVFDMYGYNTQTSRYVFVAALTEADSSDWQARDTRPVQTTPDGTFVLFASVNDLTPDAAGGGNQLYRFDAQAGEAGSPAALVRISIGEEGYNDNGNTGASAGMLEPVYAGADHAAPGGVSMTADGSQVFFNSETALTSETVLNEACTLESEGVCVEEGPNGLAQNVYEWEGGHVYLISDGQDRHAILRGGSAVTLIGADPSGSDVFFTSADQLVPEDTDSQSEIYDARVDGGVRISAGPVSCTDQCQGTAAAAPNLAVPGSMIVGGEGHSLPGVPTPTVALPTPTKSQLLTTALKNCRSKRKGHKRTVCEGSARRRFGSVRRGSVER
jgi:hypothetical protein